MLGKPRNAVIGGLVLALVAGYFVTGHYLSKAPIGLEAGAFLAGEALQKLALTFNPELKTAVSGMILAFLSALAIAGVVFFLVRAAVRGQVAAVDPSRRRFLTGAGTGAGAALLSLVAAAGAAAARGLFGLGQGHGGWSGVSKHIGEETVVRTHPEWKEAWKGSRIRSHRRLGRTGWKVSDIVLGTGRIRGEDGERIARNAIDRGVNYFDTSPDYSAAGSEQAMGRAIKGVRDRLFIATKFCVPSGHLASGTPVAGYKKALEDSLRRLGTDYVDLCHIHACDEVERLMDPNAHEAFDRLKQEGKVRFLGFSSHSPNLVQVAHGLWTPLGEIISRASREQGMGVVAMKTLKGAKQHGLAGFREEADAYSQAALRWVLSNRDVSCAVISFFELQHVDEYLHASGRELGSRDLAILEKYDREILGSYCSPHCGACLASCSAGLPIHDLLRYRMYFEDYGWEKEGMRLYSRLAKDASACIGCSAPCLGSCPVGIPIRERLRGAHELLT
jgi:aryl-alcohol dehydrogenase-like predicted oxidoreductase